MTNIYQAFGLSLVSVLSQDVPRVRFFPSSAQAEEDVAAANAATEVAQLVERNNRIGNLIADEAFNLWTDGKVGGVRAVRSGWAEIWISSGDGDWGAGSSGWARMRMFVRSVGRKIRRRSLVKRIQRLTPTTLLTPGYAPFLKRKSAAPGKSKAGAGLRLLRGAAE